MLKIRDEQLKAFENAAMQRLENKMAAHLRELAPQHCDAMGDENLGKVVKTGIKRADKYGFTFKGPVRFYLDLMIMLGSDFDTDPQYPWAINMLQHPGIPDQMEKAERLYQLTMKYSDSVFGPDYKFEKAAVRRAGTVKLNDLPLATTDSIHDFIEHLEWAYPEKTQFIGETPVVALVHKAKAQAQEHGLDDERGATVLTGLMFAFGHGAVTDPQFHWIAATLTKDFQSPTVRTERLFKRALTYQRLGESLQG